MTDDVKAYVLGPSSGGLKAVSATQWLKQLAEREKDGNTPQGVYAVVSWVYRATRLRANALARIKWELLGPNGEPLDEPPFEIDMFDFLWRTEATRCLFGAAFWLILNNGMLKTGLQYLHPSTMTFKRNKQTHALEGYEQLAFNNKWPLDEMVYLPLWNPDDDVTPGPAPAQVALVEAGLARYANEFAAGFFRDGALPMVLLTSKGPLVKGAADRIRDTFNKIFKLKRHPWQTAVLEAGMDIKQLTPPIKDLMVPELMGEVRQQIANAFEIPVTWLEDADNRATGENEDERFWVATMIPDATRIAGMMNRQLWTPMGLEFRFKFGDLEAIQKQEQRKAEGASQLMGVALDQLPLYGRERTIWVIDQYWDTMGLDMTKAPKAEEPEPAPDMTPRDDDEQEDVNPTRAVELADLDLGKWRRKVKKRGKGVDFESEWIPEDLAYSIKMALDVAETEADLLAAFDPPFV